MGACGAHWWRVSRGSFGLANRLGKKHPGAGRRQAGGGGGSSIVVAPHLSRPSPWAIDWVPRQL